jgi:hypothetical protein
MNFSRLNPPSIGVFAGRIVMVPPEREELLGEFSDGAALRDVPQQSGFDIP